MPVSPTNKAEVILRARNLLAARMDDLSDQVVIVAEDDLPQTRPQTCITVSMPGGSFDYAKQVGGGREGVHYQGTLRVSIWSMTRTDRNGHDVDALTADDSGLFQIWLKILKALVDSQLDEPETGGNGSAILTTCMYAISDTSPSRTNEDATGGKLHGANSRATMSIDFGAEFKVDLS